jgi:putative membrane protein
MIRNYADHSANERTFLAWVRTAVAIVGFGLAVARLGSASISIWSEMGLLACGGIIIVLAYLRMRQLRHKIDRQRQFDDEAPPIDALLIALVVSLFATFALFAFHAG